MDLKIVHIVLGKANPNKMNGVNKVVNELATYQTNLGYDVELWGVTHSLKHNYPERNYHTELFLDKGKFRANQAIKAKLKTLKDRTVFHLHGGFIPQFFFIVRSILKAGFEYVFTPHGAYNALALERSKYKKRFFLSTFDYYIVKHAKAIHFIGQSEVDNGVKIFGEITKVLIPNGQPILSPDRFSQNGTDCPIFGFMGRLDIQTKGLDLLLEGFKQYLDKQNGKGVLWLIGDGPELPRLKEMAQNLGIKDAVCFKGSLFGKAKEEALDQLDIFCLTSRNEGLPGVVLEAANFGLPSIVSEATNMGRYIESFQSGWVLENNSADQIAKTMKIAFDEFNESSLEKYRQRAYKMLKSEFSWGKIAKAHIKNYAA